MNARVEHHAAGYPWRGRFPEAVRLSRGEGSAAYSAETADAWWVVIDEGTLADFLDEDERESLIRIERYPEASVWRQRCIELQSRPLVSRTESTLSRYLDAVPELITTRCLERDLTQINERDHLQPWSTELLGQVLQSRSGGEVRTSVPLDYPDHWPRLGNVDIAIAEPESVPVFLELSVPVFLELKCGSGAESLGPCAWDLLKLALAIRSGDCSAGYLIAASQQRWFEEQKLGTELLGDGHWTASGTAQRYASWFGHWERRNDPPIVRVPASGTTESVGSCSFVLGGVEWSLRISRVHVDPIDWHDWKPSVG